MPELDLDGRDVVSRAGANWGELWEVSKVDNVLDKPLNELGLPLLESDYGHAKYALRIVVVRRRSNRRAQPQRWQSASDLKISRWS